MELIRRPIPVALGVLVLAAGCDGDAAGLELPPPAVGVVEVLEADLPDRVLFVGQVRAVQRVEVRVRVEGRIERKLFSDGQEVSEGQSLFVIDPAPYQARVLQARADVTAALAKEEKARADLDRSAELFESDAISRAEYDLARATFRVSTAQVSVARAALRAAELELGYTTIESPLAGRAGDTTVDLGNLVRPSTQTPMVVVTRLDPVYVEFSADERTYLEARRQREARTEDTQVDDEPFVSLLLADGNPYRYEGTVTYVSPEVDRDTGTLQLRALFPNPDRLLKPGLFGRVVFQSRTTRPRILVPEEALIRKQTGTFAFVIDDDDVVAERRVRVGGNRGELILVEDGLEAGEIVVTQGVQKIRTGATVAPTELPPLDLASDPLTARPPERWEGELAVPDAVP